MKKTCLLLLMALLPLCFISCSSDNEDETTTNRKLIVGTWKSYNFTCYYNYYKLGEISPLYDRTEYSTIVTYTFSNDGSYQMIDEPHDHQHLSYYKGTYNIVGKKIVIHATEVTEWDETYMAIDGEVDDTLEIQTLTENSLELLDVGVYDSYGDYSHIEYWIEKYNRVR